MPYTLRLYLCLFIVGFVAFVLVDWLSPLGPVVNALLAAVVAYLTILVGQRVLGRRICSDARLRRTGGRNGTALVTSSREPYPSTARASTSWVEPQKEKHQCETKAAYKQNNPAEKIHDVPARLQLKFTRTLRSGRLRRRIGRRTRGHDYWSSGKPAERSASCIEALTPGQWPAYSNKFRASASSQLTTALLPKNFK